MSRILIVDDDPVIRDLLKRIVQKDTITVDEAESGRQALAILQAKTFDLILLDISLSGDLDGFQVLQSIRDSGTETPVMIITGNQEEYSAVYGYGLGADDYITKPVKPVVLRAKIEAVLRRASLTKQAPEVGNLTCGLFRFDPAKYHFYKRDRELGLTSREAMLLLFFMKNPERVFTKEQIYAQVWDEVIVDDNTIMVYISRLRNKIEDDPRKPRHLTTVWGVGYQFIPS